MRKKVPIGNSDFRDLIENDYHYVDKSLLIQEVLDASAKILLLTRPRRFGKTVNMTMLRYFFEEPGRPELFTGLAIAKKAETMQLQGRYPVVFLTFKDIKQSSYEDFVQQMQSVLAAEYRRHEVLLDGDVLREEELESFRQILKKTASRSDTERSILRSQ